jgi:hypothetical protein
MGACGTVGRARDHDPRLTVKSTAKLHDLSDPPRLTTDAYPSSAAQTRPAITRAACESGASPATIPEPTISGLNTARVAGQRGPTRVVSAPQQIERDVAGTSATTGGATSANLKRRYEAILTIARSWSGCLPHRTGPIMFRETCTRARWSRSPRCCLGRCRRRHPAPGVAYARGPRGGAGWRQGGGRRLSGGRRLGGGWRLGGGRRSRRRRDT